VCGYSSFTPEALTIPAQRARSLGLNAETAKILKDPRLVEQFAGRGVRLVGNPVAEFTAFIPKERARWAGIVKASGVKLE
jgi:tripartite-type tricarboxylate transporter receptor subunit TctC